MQSVPLKKHVSFVYSLRCLSLSVWSFDIGDDRCLWGGGVGGGEEEMLVRKQSLTACG